MTRFVNVIRKHVATKAAVFRNGRFGPQSDVNRLIDDHVPDDYGPFDVVHGLGLFHQLGRRRSRRRNERNGHDVYEHQFHVFVLTSDVGGRRRCRRIVRVRHVQFGRRQWRRCWPRARDDEQHDLHVSRHECQRFLRNAEWHRLRNGPVHVVDVRRRSAVVHGTFHGQHVGRWALEWRFGVVQ